MEPTLAGHLLLATLMIAVIIGYGVIVARQWRIWRRGADARWSTRLKAAGFGLAGVWAVLVISLVLVRLLLLDSVPVLLRNGGLLVPALPAVACYGIGLGAQWVEYEQTRRHNVQLGRPVPPRMVPPVLIGAFWFVGTLLACFAVGAGMVAMAWPTMAHSETGMPAGFTTVVGTVIGAGLIAGAGHVWWQHHRRVLAHRAAVTADREQY